MWNASVLRITLFNIFINNLEQRIDYIFTRPELMTAGSITIKIRVILNEREK